MNLTDIKNLLENKGFIYDGNATQLHQYTVPQRGRSSFVSESVVNRSNTSWGRGEYIIVPPENSDITEEQVLNGWKRLAGYYQNQYLILGIEPGVWRLYDYDGNLLGGNDEIYRRLRIDRPQITGMTPKYRKLVAAIRTKPFLLLAGISGTGKSRIVRKLAQSCVTEELQGLYDPNSTGQGFDRWSLHKPANFELIQVKPNWHNSMEVVGYKSNIGGAHYEFTPFIEFVARAWLHQDVPFFLCLDEMNLAPVEQYFAEFLSAIESRSLENGEYMTDPIVKPFESFDTKNEDGTVIDHLCDRMIAHLVGPLDTEEKQKLAEHLRTKGLTLPQNLIVMGTVNMDETTFSFSRKVLDRAMSIVMDEVNIDAFMSGESEDDVPDMQDDVLTGIINRPLKGIEETTEDQKRQVKEFFAKLNDDAVLGLTPFKLGYRAINEALLYVHASERFGNDDVESALDQFTMMKILSRIEGDKRSLNDVLDKLKEIIPVDSDSSRKLGQMITTLETSQFVSYWT